MNVNRSFSNGSERCVSAHANPLLMLRRKRYLSENPVGGARLAENPEKALTQVIAMQRKDRRLSGCVSEASGTCEKSPAPVCFPVWLWSPCRQRFISLQVNDCKDIFASVIWAAAEDSGIASRSNQDAYSMLEPSSTNPVGDAHCDESGIPRAGCSCFALRMNQNRQCSSAHSPTAKKRRASLM